MKILFLSISYSERGHISFYEELLQEFVRNGHEVSVACATERRQKEKTYIQKEKGIQVLRIRIGNITGSISTIEKGISTISIDMIFKRSIQKHFNGRKFDLLLYPTPPITLVHTVEYMKKRTGAHTYLLLKDIFPQNAVDLGMMPKTGVKSVIYKYFRNKEKKFYGVSDYIGCMSKANVEYVLQHNTDIAKRKIEVCPNSIKVKPKPDKGSKCKELRKKYNIPADKKVFVYGGNLGKPQGIKLMLKCIAKCADIKEAYFLIVGGGTEANKVEKFIDSGYADHVKYIGKLPKDEYEMLIEACDVGLIFLDSCFTIPNFPSRILSYMQSAMPVLAATDLNTDIGKVIVEGGFGWSCRSDCPEQFREYVKQAIEMDLGSMGNNAYQYLSEHYDVGTSYNIIMKHFSK